ncbi:unnamed protein product [Symbiodinium sp. KB8]|nr:unnamed protein product [Symbiodinium sp. KB8]
MIRCRAPATAFVRSPPEFEAAMLSQEAVVHMSADIMWNWWLRGFLHMPVQLVAASPPCQPWSSAGYESGLDSLDGMLMLRLIDAVSAAGIPVVVLEQVAGFLKHPHYPVVMKAWARANYEVKWQETLNLLDVLPCQRVRHICVFARQGALPEVALTPVSWTMQRRVTLGHAHAVFDLPGPLLRAAIPDEATLAKYLDPWYVPPSTRAGARQQTPAQYRVKTVDGHASTFLAMYQAQHTLPENMISSRGILGCLLQHQGCLRFFAGAEIASLHGAVQPVLLEEDAQVQMRMLGNAIAIPHAVVGLVYACTVLGLDQVPDPALAVHTACQLRLHNQNTVLLPVAADWILCARDQADAVLKGGAGLALISKECEFLSESSRVSVVKAAAAFGWPQTFTVRHSCGCLSHESFLSVYGMRLAHQTEFQHCMVAVPEDPEVPVFPLLHLEHAGENLHVFKLRGGVAAVAPAAGAMNLWLGTPFHLLNALGWQADVHGYPLTQGCFMTITMTPIPGVMSAPKDRLLGLWRIWLFIAKLQNSQATRGDEAFLDTEVQIGAQTVWAGKLPACLDVGIFEQWREQASAVCELPGRGRIFSGPFPLPDQTTIAEVKLLERRHVVRKGGQLLLSLQPECVGGGAKAENASWTQTRAASLCLSSGLDLARTTQFVDQLTTAAGVAKLSAVLQGPTQDRWHQMLDLAKQVNVPTPPLPSGQAKAEGRMKKAAQRRRAQDRCSIQASDVSLAPEFFYNADGSPANLLHSLQPGASGVFLVDEGEAAELLGALTGVQPDELCVVVLGHNCPAACTILEAARLPHVINPILLWICRRFFAAPLKAYSDEFDHDAWKTLTVSPVKTVQELFRKAGVEKVFSNPWGRQFFAGDKPTAPASAEKAVFQARVDAKVVSQLLEVSGHNRVYIVPRNPDRSLQNEYSIVWLGSSKAEVLKLSLQVKGQLGVVRSRSRFGIRVVATKFEQTFQQLRPGQIAPAKVEVKSLFRVGPLPAGAGAEEIREWATKAAWNVRVLKALGATHAAVEPPSVFPAFNGQTVLITKLQPRAPQRPVLQSGSFSGKQSVSSTASGQRQEEDPWTVSDPWSSYASKQRQKAQTTPVASLPTASTAPAPRHLGGPTEQRFQEQETRLQALETGLQTLRVQQDQQHQDLVGQQKTDRAAAQAAHQQLQDRIGLIGADFSKQLQQSVASLQGAQAQQQQQMQTSLDEIKQLMLSCRESREVCKKAKTAETDELQRQQPPADLWSHSCAPVPDLRRCAFDLHNEFWPPTALAFTADTLQLHKPTLVPATTQSEFAPPPVVPASRDLGHDPYSATRVGEAKNPGPPLILPRRLGQQPLSRYFGRQAQPDSACQGGSSQPSQGQRRSPANRLPTGASNRPRVADGDHASCSNVPGRTFVVEIINPTSVLNKAHTILDRKADIYFIAETAAVARTQHQLAQQLRQRKFQAVWSPPVAPHQHADHVGPSLRGCAVGSAVWSRFPLRAPFRGMDPQVAATQRVSVAYSRIGALHFRCLAVYGWPANHTQAKQLNATLLQHVLDLVADGGVPTVIAGDFNIRPQALPCWPAFQAMGFQEVHELWQNRGHPALPPTCKGATFHDTALLPPVLLNLLVHASVDVASFDFDAHAPLRLEFRWPAHSPCSSVWRKPRCWMEFSPSAAKVHQAYQATAGCLDDAIAHGTSADDVDSAFQTWACLIENAVDSALAEQHHQDPVQHPTGHLPRSHRGRCVYRHIRQRPCPAAAKQARHGDFDPPEEAITVQSRARTKQVRRLRSFLCSVRAAQRRGDTASPSVHLQLAQEWQAICRARGYGPSFVQWLLAFDHFDVFYSPQPEVLFRAPPEEWLREVIELVQHDCIAMVRQEASHRQALFRFRNHLDEKQNSSRAAYAALRPHARPPFTAVPVQETQEATLHSEVDSRTGWYQVPEPRYFQRQVPLSTVHGPVVIQGEAEDDRAGTLLQLAFLAVQSLPAQVVLHQETEASSAIELNRQFMKFWHPIWARDRGEHLQEAAWQQFLDALPPAPPECLHFELELLDLDLWRDHARKLKVRSATGYCGFSNRALRWLPDGPLWHLAQLFEMSSRCGFPAHLARATVHTLAKVDMPQGMKDGRPITVFSNLYRLWSSLCSRSLLRAWAAWLPAAVAGSVPARSVRDVSIAIQLRVEAALLDHRPLAGVSVDIIKCFNQIPRAPMTRLLRHLGVPESVLSLWADFLCKALRHAVFLEEIGLPVGSTTGVPEGCPLSVLCMVALCWYLAELPRPADTDLYTYVDNLSWTACCPTSLQCVLETAVRFCRSLLLPVDWNKSFAWSTAARLHRWLEGDAQLLLPHGAKLKVVKGAKDLGVMFRFRAKGSPGQVDPDVNLAGYPLWCGSLYRFPGCGARIALGRGACHAGGSPRSFASLGLALSAVTPVVDDPAVFILSQAICALQRQLKVNTELGEWWLARTVNALTEARILAIGPATVLAKLLQQADWTLGPDGLARGPGHTWFSLRHTPARAVRAAIRQAWREQVLQKFDAGAQVYLARTVVGALLSGAAKATWDPLQSSACPLCGEVDTKHHRLLYCPATAQARKPFQELLDVIAQEQPEWFHCPYPGSHASEPFLRLLWRSREVIEPVPVAVTPPSLETAGEVHLFTDGTCANPTCPEARHAAWAVLLYIGPWPFPGAWIQGPTGRHHGFATWFSVVAQGLVPGSQTISRAEVLALCQAAWVAKQFSRGVVTLWSDSLTALRLARGLQAGENRQQHFASDLVSRVPSDLFRQIRLRKIAAHQHVDTVPENLVLPTLGNHLADTAAKNARQQDLATAVDTCDEVAAHSREQQDRFLGYCQYQMALLQVAKPLQHALANEQRLVYNDDDMQLPTVISRWLSLQAESVTDEVESAADMLLQADMTYADRVVAWCNLLCWPATPPDPHAFTGITYLELMFNFVVCTGVVPRTGAQSSEAGIDLLSTGGILMPVVLRELVVAFVLFLRCCEKRLACKLFASPTHGRIRSLEFVGFGMARKGLLIRPGLPRYGETIRCVHRVMTSQAPGESLRDYALQLFRPR